MRRNIKLSKLTLYALLLALPLNLGLHFILPSAYVGGLLIDYLIPTLFVQDIFALLLVLFWVIEDRPQIVRTLKSHKAVIFLIYIVALSTLSAPRFIPSAYILLRWILYAFTALYISKNFDMRVDTKFLTKALCYWAIFLGVLATGQYIKQGSVFNNYIVLGEQPYTSATPAIDHENVFGNSRIPAYGLFRHPNIFGGFLAISLVWILYAFRTKFIGRKLFSVSYCVGLAGLYLTFSIFSWIGFIFGTLILLFENKTYLRRITICLFLSLSLLGFVINLLKWPASFTDNPSVYKRIDLLTAGYKMLSSTHYLFGVGINSASLFIEEYLVPNNFLRFVQPTHNAFVLLASEIGLLGLGLLLYIIFTALARARYQKYFIFVSLLQIIFLASFDHYFVTIQQTFLLLWLILGIAWL